MSASNGVICVREFDQNVQQDTVLLLFRVGLVRIDAAKCVNLCNELRKNSRRVIVVYVCQVSDDDR